MEHSSVQAGVARKGVHSVVRHLLQGPALHTTFWLSVSGDLPVVPGASYMPFEQASAARLPGILATGGEAEDTSRPW
jgi:hypothetical protein